MGRQVLKRGEIWTAAGGQAYIGKPRPVLIVQDDRFAATDSVTVCPLTSDPVKADFFRIPIVPDGGNGLRYPSRVMTDKISTIPRERIGTRVGQLSTADMGKVERGVLVFLGIAGARTMP